ncbi:FtsW/RodA/SpoVE family cell cycle protein [Clostridium sp. D2Q-11]|uniref:FtsW/RodA/SpoVE family cell cycle protein n=1 Tax=Anaeromonas frigoriresistens TaxID=2683708 RepID=A0A942Z7G8_9FIRM|nr:FtsW/RodA/SpoVE family cell cycle protein [Anaeromonas frigoriresistens]MBS4537248.1 FtsW/RodA/SpoVE family cell cycle protein [Anaeromonas frigoriresistens]
MFKRLFSFKVPQNLLFLLNLLSLSLVILYNKSFDRLSIGVAVGLPLIIYISNLLLLKVSSGDHYLLLIVSMMMSLGILMIYRINPELGFKQVIWYMVGIITFYATYFIVKRITLWEKGMGLYIGLSFLLFLSTLIFGKTINGSTNWIKISGYSFQPSEIIKILFVFFLASYFVNRDKFENKYILSVIVYAHIGFLFIQRDLGSAMLFYMVFLVIFYVYENDRKFILLNLFSASLMAMLGYFAFSHVQVRVETWLNPWEDISGKGYQITQSLFAIAEGGFLGSGIGNGYPTFIPEVQTDFIFSAICEEMGVLTGIAVIMLFLILIYRGIKIALEQRNQFFRIVALGITATLGFQAFIILGGVTKLIPLTGVTLPFLSYGGSSLIMSFASLGVLQVASEYIYVEQEEDYEHGTEEDN